MSKEKQIEENIFYVIHTKSGYWGGAYIFSEQLRKAKIYTSIRHANETARRLNRNEYCATVLEVDLCLAKEGEWEWFEEWSPSTPEHPRECDDCGWQCGKCKTALTDAVGGYWDDPLEKPNLNFCPKCGAKMKGGAE